MLIHIIKHIPAQGCAADTRPPAGRAGCRKFRFPTPPLQSAAKQPSAPPTAASFCPLPCQLRPFFRAKLPVSIYQVSVHLSVRIYRVIDIFPVLRYILIRSSHVFRRRVGGESIGHLLAGSLTFGGAAFFAAAKLCADELCSAGCRLQAPAHRNFCFLRVPHGHHLPHYLQPDKRKRASPKARSLIFCISRNPLKAA